MVERADLRISLRQIRRVVKLGGSRPSAYAKEPEIQKS